MTRYTVVWDADVESNFVDAWVQSDPATRKVLTEIANTIDRKLRTNAEVQGEIQLDGFTRAVFVQIGVAEVTVYFEASELDQQVVIRRLVLKRRMDVQ